MLVSAYHHVSDARETMASADGNAELRRTIAVLEELLAQSICLRDLYRNARWQTADVRYRGLRQLFDRHYNEQLRLVDVLIDRIRTLGGGQQVFARDFLQGSQFARALRGAKAASHLLNELLDAHEAVLSSSRPNGSATHAQWAHDFAVGQVVLSNDSQSASISDQLAGCEPRQRSIPRHGSAAPDCE